MLDHTLVSAARLAIMLLATGLIAGCAPATTGGVRPVMAAVSPNVVEYELNAGIDTTFDAVLRVAQALNLNVESMDRPAGLIRFAPATLSAQQLDTFCYYPLIHPTTNQEWDTFTNWNARSSMAVTGEVTYTALVTRADKGSTLTLRSTWAAGTAEESYMCNSRGVSEDDFASRVKAIAE